MGFCRAYIGTSYKAPRSSNMVCSVPLLLAGLSPAAFTVSSHSSSYDCERAATNIRSQNSCACNRRRKRGHRQKNKAIRATYRLSFGCKAKRLPHFLAALYPSFPKLISETREMLGSNGRLHLPWSDGANMAIPLWLLWLRFLVTDLRGCATHGKRW